jgi:hypothetical protein
MRDLQVEERVLAWITSELVHKSGGKEAAEDSSEVAFRNL